MRIALLTGTIEIKNTPFTTVIDSKIRLKQYLNVIEKLIVKSKFDIIIFCENSNYIYSYEEIYKLAEENKKKLEILRFQGSSEEILAKGKGYGEGEIIEYALSKSKYLKNKNDFFYKLTGRIYIENINSILREDKNLNNFFIDSHKSKIVDTRFFKVNIEFYKNHLQNKYKEVNDYENNYLEHVFYKYLNKKDNIYPFKIYPKYKGISGSTGQKYDLGKIKYLIKVIKLKLGFMDVKNE